MDHDAIIKAASLCRKFEGLYLRPYLCPAKVPTIGYGSTRYEDGVRIRLDDPPITKERAEAMLQYELRKCLRVSLKLCQQLVLWGHDPTAAIVDFVFNLGEGRLAASTLRRKIMDDDTVGAKRELMKWVYGGGKRLRGLELRRAAECALLP
jgi:lysozyme